MKTISLLTVFLMLSLCPLLHAQHLKDAVYNAKDSAMLGQRIILRVFGVSRMMLFDECLKLSPLEQETFFTLVSDYETDKNPWRARRVVLLKAYNEEYTSLNQEMVDYLVRNLNKNEREYIAIQKRYQRRMLRVLGANKAAKFFALDSYLETVTKLYIQNDLPFIQELEQKRQGYHFIETSRK